MKRQTLLKSTLCLLMALVCNVTWAQPAISDAPANGQWAENTTWYRIKTKNNYSLRADVLTSNGHLALSNTTDANSDIALWCVVGDETNGYRFYNKAKGTEVVLGMTGSDDNAYAIFTADGTSGYATAFDFATTTSGENYQCVKEHGSDNNYWNRLNKSDYRLKYWNSTSATQNDDGSAFMFTAVDLATLTYATAEELTAAKDLMQKAPGYPKTTSSPYMMLDRLVTSGGVVKSELDAAVNAYKTCNDVILPEDGKAYTFTALFKNGNKLYMKYANGAKVSLSATSSDASTFVCKELRAGVYAFITEDGKILTWVGKDDNNDPYKEDNKILGYSSNYATEYNGKSDWNDITVKKNDTNEEQFGLLRLVGRRAISGTTTSSFYANKGGGFEQAGDDNLFNDVNTSGWILTEVEHANNDKQNLALAKISAKLQVAADADKLGEGIGCAHYIVGGEKKHSTAEINAGIDAATTVDAVNTIKNSYKVTLPLTDKAYKMAFKAKDETLFYIVAEGAKISTTSDEANASVFYCIESASNNYPYIFISEDGWVLAYHEDPNSTLLENYDAGGDRCNFKIEGMVDKKDNINSTIAVRRGTVCITAGKRTASTDQDGCFVFKSSANVFDKAPSPFHNDNFTSAIVMTEVENYEVPEAQKTKIDAILNKEAKKTEVEAIEGQLKNQPGYYYCTINGEKTYDADAIIALIDATKSLKTLAEISTAVNGKTLIVPEVGKGYRIKGATSNNYIDAVNCHSGDQMGMKAADSYSDLGTIFYLDTDNKLLNYATNSYIYETRHIAKTEENNKKANKWTFTFTTLGKFKLIADYGSEYLHDNTNRADRCSDDGNNHEFYLEEVDMTFVNEDFRELFLTALAYTSWMDYERFTHQEYDDANELASVIESIYLSVDDNTTIAELRTKILLLEEIIDKFNIREIKAGFYNFVNYECNDAGEYLSDDRKADGKNQRILTINVSEKNIFYYDGTALFSYASGFGFEHSVCNTETPNEMNSFTFGEAYEIGKYTVMSNLGTSGGESEWADNCYWVNNNGELDRTKNAADASGWDIVPVTSLPVTIGKFLHATFYAPVAVKIPEGVKAYTGVVKNDDWFTLTEVDEIIPAETAVVLIAEETATYNFEIVESDKEAITPNQLKGTAPTIVNNKQNNYYTLQAHDFNNDGEKDGIAFKKYIGDNLNGFRAYLELPAGTNAAALRIRFANEGGGTTGAEQLTIDNSHLTIYDLTGRRVMKPTKGMYIVNGKKVIF